MTNTQQEKSTKIEVDGFEYKVSLETAKELGLGFYGRVSFFMDESGHDAWTEYRKRVQLSIPDVLEEGASQTELNARYAEITDLNAVNRKLKFDLILPHLIDEWELKDRKDCPIDRPANYLDATQKGISTQVLTFIEKVGDDFLKKNRSLDFLQL